MGLYFISKRRLVFLQLAQCKCLRNSDVWLICQKQMSIYFVITSLIHSSHLQNSLKGERSSAQQFLSSCSHVLTKAREEVSHQAALPPTKLCRVGAGTIYTHTRAHAHSPVAFHKYPTRCNSPRPPPQASKLSLSVVNRPVRQVPTQLPISIPQHSSLSDNTLFSSPTFTQSQTREPIIAKTSTVTQSKMKSVCSSPHGCNLHTCVIIWQKSVNYTHIYSHNARPHTRKPHIQQTAGVCGCMYLN